MTLTNIFERVRSLGLSMGQYAVFGSALLDVWNIRPASDLDIIATLELYEELKRQGMKEKQANGFTILIKEDANITTVQDRATDGDYNPDRVQLINNAVFIRGIPFVRIEEVIACKRAYGREKDLEDIASIEKYLQNHDGNLYSCED